MIQSLVAGACALAVPFAVAAVLAAQPAPPAVSPQRALLNQYCVGCHNQRAKAAGQEAARKLTLDDLDVAKIGVTVTVYSPSEGNTCFTSMPPRVPNGRPSMW